MRVAYDGRVLAAERTGDRVYLENLLTELVDLMPPQDLLVYYDGCKPDPIPHLAVGKRPTRIRFGKAWKTWFWAKHLRADAVDICHTQYFAPLNATCPVVTTVHDVSFAAHPEYFPLRDRLVFRLFMPSSLRRADAIIVPSEHTKGEVGRFYPEARGKMKVMPYAGSAAIHPVPAEEARARLRERFGIDFPFVLVLGQVHPRKNLVRVLRAFAGVAPDYPDLHLVAAGPDIWRAADVWQAAERAGIADRVVRTGVVSDEDVSCLMSVAALFCYVSLYEGFGLPVLEAMKCGAPVLASDTTSLPEVVGGAALLVNPLSVEEIRAGMRSILSDQGLYEDLREAGGERWKKFSWQETARRTAAIYGRMTCSDSGLSPDLGCRT